MQVKAEKAWAAAALLFNAVVWGLSWWPLRALQSQGVHPLWATTAIYVVALVLIGAVSARQLAGRWRDRRLWLLALACGLTNLGFNWGITVGDVLRVVLLFYLMPAWAVLLGWLMLGERPNTASLLRTLLALAGVVVVLKSPDTPWPLPRDGADFLGLLGGFAFAWTNIVLRQLAATPGAARMFAMFAGGAAMALAVALVGAFSGHIPTPAQTIDSTGILAALGLGVALLLGNTALQYGATRLAAQTTALLMLTEVVFAGVSSVLLGAAEPSPRVAIGAVLIGAAALLSARANH